MKKQLIRVPTADAACFKRRLVAALIAGIGAAGAHAAGLPTLDVVEVKAGANELVGTADSATEGTVSAKQLETRPLLRPGEVLEVVPGVIITQHSGDGKANQYFLRGFNLDHGTDFATSVNGMPVNMPTHGHGQGYSDLNFLIPELVERVRYRKGPYAAEDGDFASAGSARIDYFRRLPQNFVDLGFGENGYRRSLLAGSPEVAGGALLYGVEWYENDGPWKVAENFGKFNGVLRYSQGTTRDGWSVTGMAYRAQWRSTDQVAQRAIDGGLIGRFGSLDTSDGGRTHRYSLSADWARSGNDASTRATIYAMDYRLKLVSNFTYFLDNPVAGDQFEQADRRRVFGASGAHTWLAKAGGLDLENMVGFTTRHDRIDPVALYLTSRGDRQTTIREDRVNQSSVGLYAQNATQWTPWLRSTLGWRHDFYRFDVHSDRALNSGKAHDNMGGPKASLVFGPWAGTEFYLNAGSGFHSNDARGATTRINPDPRDPGFLGAVERVTPLVRAKGYEAGVRSAPLPGLQTTLALWRLDIDSELLFIGDAGTTEASRPSRRQGVEWSAYYHPLSWLTVDADVSVSHARFRDGDPAGDRIPGAIERVASLGVGVDGIGPWYGGLRLRYFGPRPLIEDNSVRSSGSTLVNLRAGYRINSALQVTLDVLNLFDRKVNDIEYFYESQLAGEAAPVEDKHVHPAEPRTFRVSLRMRF